MLFYSRTRIIQKLTTELRNETQYSDCCEAGVKSVRYDDDDDDIDGGGKIFF